MQKLLEKWKKRLQSFLDHPNVVINGPATSTLMGVQEGRVKALKQCIEELENTIKATALKSQIAELEKELKQISQH